VLTVAFFVGDYLLRYLLHPEFERVSLLQGRAGLSQPRRRQGSPAQDAPRT
jgi:hypothetical protein